MTLLIRLLTSFGLPMLFFVEEAWGQASFWLSSLAHEFIHECVAFTYRQTDRHTSVGEGEA